MSHDIPLSKTLYYNQGCLLNIPNENKRTGLPSLQLSAVAGG